MRSLIKCSQLFAFWLCALLCFAFARPAHADAPVFAPNALTVNKSASYLLDTVQYTIQLDNTAGTADALDVVFTDHLPQGVEVQLFNLDGVPQVLTLLMDGLYIGTIPKGTSRTITIGGLITNIPIRPDAASYVNQASWTYRYRPTPGAPKVNASVTTNSVTTNMVRLESTMAIANVALAPILNLGTEMTFTIRVANTGTLNSSGTTLTNLIPVGAVYVAGSTKLNGTTLPDLAAAGPYVLGGLINSPGRPAGQINIGEEAVITFKATALVLPAVNVAVIDPDGLLGPIPPLNLRGYIQGATTDLSITKTDGVSSVSPGNTLTYTIAVKNNGATALDSVRVVDSLPVTLNNPIWTASTGTYNSGSGEWTGLTLGAGQTITLTLVAKVSPLALTNIVNSATVYPPSGVTDSNNANNSTTDTDTLSLTADLGVTQTDGITSVTAGAPVNYTITVSNAGPSTISSLTLTDILPTFLTNPVFTPDEGSYNSATGAWTGLNLASGQTVQMTLSGVVSALATGVLTNLVTVSNTLGTLDTNALNNSATDTDTIIPAASVSGTVYLDANHNSNLDTTESGTGVNGLFIKLVPVAATSASQAVAVNAATGAYTLSGVLPGIYNLVLDNNNTLTDITPSAPSGYLGTEAPAQRRDNVAVTVVNLLGLNFGLWHGSKASGTVFEDNGAGGATANDGTRNGNEAGLDGVTVKLFSAATTLDTALTDGSGGYTLWIPFGAANPLRIVATLPAGTIGVAGRLGNTAGTFDRATATLTFSSTTGTVYTDTGFAAVAVNILTGGATQNGSAGGAIFFPHTFTAGTKGTVTFSGVQTNAPQNGGWNGLLYRDTNANGALDNGETPLTGPLNLNSGESAALIVKVGVPADALPNSQSQYVLSANFAYDGVTPALNAILTATDAVAVGTSPSLVLVQTVDKVTAKTGEIITYTITYRNSSPLPLAGVGIRNATPAFTAFESASFGPLPASLTSCNIVKPAVGATGDIRWDFVGVLAPGGSGTVSFQAKIQ
jgi:uncharacterized repeat protein (TIGR01451 family)